MKTKWTKLLSLICSLALLVGLLPVTVFATEPCTDGCFTEGGITYCPISVTDVEVVNPTLHPFPPVGPTDSPYKGEITIPKTVTHGGNTYNVTRIAQYAFSRTPVNQEDGNLTTVTLPEGITEIGESAFYGCTKLSTLNLPSTLTSIGVGAFGGCSDLTSLTIPAGVTSGLVASLTDGGTGAPGNYYPYNFPYDEESGTGIKFAEGSNYKFETVSDGTNTATVLYNGTTFDGVLKRHEGPEITGDEITNLTIREGTTAISDSAFAGLVGLETVTMPSSVKTIGDNAFGGCSSLASIDLSNVEEIGAMAFAGAGLKSANLSSLKELKTIEVDDSVEVSAAFMGCKNLETVIFDNPAKVPADAFLMVGSEDSSVTFVMKGETPPNFTGEFTITNLTVIVPEEAKENYKNDSVLGGYISNGEDETEHGYALTLTPTTVSVEVDKTVPLNVKSTLPTGATIEVTSDNACATAVLSKDMKTITVTGVSAGETTITATIKMNGAVLTSATCTVTVTEKSVVPTPDPVRPVNPMYGTSTPSTKHGTVTVSPSRAPSGTLVTITAEPDKGYVLDRLTVTDSKGNNVKLTEKGDGVFTFRMPSGGVTVDAKFVRATSRFVDVADNAWYRDAVEYVYEAGLMNGVGGGKFNPLGETTRGMIVTILYRMEGSPRVNSDGAYWWSDARAWAMEAGVSDGTNMTANITREQFAAMLYRFASANGIDTSERGNLNRFADSANVSDWAKDAMQWAVAEGIIGGANGKLNPKGLATRAEVAAMFMRFDKLFG